MRELRIDGTLILAVDHGYGNIKTANTVFSNGFVERDTEPVMSTDYLYYGGKYYVLDQGHKNYTKDKVMDNDFYILTVAAIAKELYLRNVRCEKIHLAVGVPLKWMDSQKESFQAYMLQNSEIRFVYKGRIFEVEIAGCSVMPQCYAAVAEILPEFKGLNMIVDIGNGTMNAMFLQDGRPVENKMWTELFGVRQCALKIHQKLLDKFQEDVPDSIINTFLMNRMADIDPEYEYWMETTAKEYVRELTAKIFDFGYNEKTMKLYVLGGGAKLLEHFSIFDRSRITFNFDINANAKGYEYFCYVALKKKKLGIAG